MATDQVSIDILAKVDNAIKNIESLSNKTEVALGNIQKNVKTTNLAFSSFLGNLAANLTGKIFESALDGAQKLWDTFIIDGVRAAQEQEDAINKLNFALQATGQYSEKTSQELQVFSSQLQDNSKYADEVILSNTALLASLTKLDTNGLKVATQAAVDLAAATGKDLNEATLLIAKASEGEIGAFKRLGIEIKKGVNDAETFANTLRALERFQGAAANQTLTFSGAVAKLKNTFGDLQEATGGVITENKAFASIMNVISGFIKQLTDLINSNKTEIQRIFTDLTVLLTKFAGEIIKVSSNIFNLIDTVKLYATGLELLFKNPIEGVKALTGSYADSAKSIENFKQKNGALAETFIQLEKNVASNNNVITKFQSLVDENIIKISDAAKTEVGTFASNYVEKRNIIEEFAAYKLTKDQEDELAAQTAIEKDLEQYYQYQLAKSGIDSQNAGERLAKEVELGKQILENTDKNSKEYLKIKENVDKKERQLNLLKLQASSQFFGDLSSLMQTKSRELFEIGKAAAIAAAIVDGYLAVQKALSTFPPPFSFAVAAAVGVRTAVQIAGIQGTNMATGGIVPQGYPRDTFPANLTSSERVINVQQNKDLTDFLNEQKKPKDNEAKELLTTIKDVLVEIMTDNKNKENNIIINIGNREIIKEIRSGLRAGYSLEVA